MTDDQWAELEPFARAADQANQQVATLAFMNRQKATRSVLDHAAAFARAKVAASMAQQALDAARQRILAV